MSSGISLFIVILTVLNIAGMFLLLWWMRRPRGADPAPGSETTGHVWDGDLREYNNPLPRWWLWLFILSIAFGVGYLVLYPGLGNYAGRLGWSSAGQYAVEHREAEAQEHALMAKFANRSIDTLAADPAARAVGRNLFLNNCAVCHGSDGHGATHFPNLTDKDWLWGGDAQAIETTISAGRQGVMIAWEGPLGSQGVEDVLAYVLSLSGRSVPAGDMAHGQAIFAQTCAVCHGPEGKGNPTLGAPNLTDNTWLHGGSIEAVRETIAKGRTGVMPAWGEKLGAERVRLLAAYVLSMGSSGGP